MLARSISSWLQLKRGAPLEILKKTAPTTALGFCLPIQQYPWQDKNGMKKAYENCVTFNAKMSVEDARALCKKTVYGETK